MRRRNNMKFYKADHSMDEVYEGLNFTNNDSVHTKCNVVKILGNQFSIVDFHNKFFRGRKIVNNQKILSKKILFVNYLKKEKSAFKKNKKST